MAKNGMHFGNPSCFFTPWKQKWPWRPRAQCHFQGHRYAPLKKGSTLTLFSHGCKSISLSFSLSDSKSYGQTHTHRFSERRGRVWNYINYVAAQTTQWSAQSHKKKRRRKKGMQETAQNQKYVFLRVVLTWKAPGYQQANQISPEVQQTV